MREKECQNVSENIALIRLQQDKKAKEVLISTLEAQLQVTDISKIRYCVNKIPISLSNLTYARLKILPNDLWLIHTYLTQRWFKD